MKRQYDRKLVLENGTEYPGFAFGDREKECVCEVVFNTSMAGYQEIVSDPAYAGTAVVMTYPLIGNYGVATTISKAAFCLSARLSSENTTTARRISDIQKHFRRFWRKTEFRALKGLDTQQAHPLNPRQRQYARADYDAGHARVKGA